MMVIVEWAKANIIYALLLERNIFGNDASNVCCVLDSFDNILGYHSRFGIVRFCFGTRTMKIRANVQIKNGKQTIN